MKAKPNPKCPVCGTAKHVVAQGSVEITYCCKGCGGMFEGDTNEGGDYFADPSKRMERQEERRRR